MVSVGRYTRERNEQARTAEMSIEDQVAKNLRKVELMTDDGYIFAARAMRDRPDLTERTPLITAPTLVSCGELDGFYPSAQRDARLIPNSRLSTIRGAAHDSVVYRPQLFKRSVFEFLEDVEAGRDVRGEREYE